MSFYITNYRILVLLAPTNCVFFRRATIVGGSGNYRATPFPTTAAIRLVFRTAAIPTARLRRFRVARLFRLRVRCRLSRCGIACRGRTTRTGGGITLVGTLAGVLHNFLGLDGQLVGRIHQAARPEPCRLYRRWPPPHQ